MRRALLTQQSCWTDGQDFRLRQLRAQGQTWDGIADELGVTRWSAIERGRKIGAPAPLRERLPAPADPERRPLCPGHPITWGTLTRNTCCEGGVYPFPVFLD